MFLDRVSKYLVLFLCAAISVLVTGVSSEISAAPDSESSPAADDLAQIVLIISSTQVVGQPLMTEARIILLDSNDNQLTDYDLAAYPITLVSDTGTLTPGVLDDPALLSGGVISILAADVIYRGPTGNVEIYATDGVIFSSNVIVSFNGYDILKAFDFKGNDISQIYSGLPTTIHATVQNKGSKVADSEPTVKAYFKSGGGSIKHIFYEPQANGLIDTLPIKLETPNLTPGEDTMVLELTCDYLVSDTLLTSFSSLHIPVTVYELATFEVVDNSLVPDTVYPEVPFDMAFDVAAVDFPGQIDSTDLTIQLADTLGGEGLTTIYQGVPVYDDFVGGVISYTGLQAAIDTAAGLDPGHYFVRMDYKLISGGNIFNLENLYPDSIALLAPASLAYFDESLAPIEVSGGADISFNFDINLSGVSFLEIQPESTLFIVTGVDFSATVNLIVPSNILNEGINEITTEQLFIPIDQMGENLTVTAWFGYRQAGSANYLKFTTDFGGQTVAVTELPTVQIISLTAIIPNRPRVNVEQPFQLLCRVANQSDIEVNNLELNFFTDGNSDFTPRYVVPNIPALDTAEFYFDITADENVNINEVFQVEIISKNVEELPPLDDIEIIVIEEPARLLLSYNTEGIVNGLVQPGDTFVLNVNLVNLGQAGTSTGRYRLSSGGIDLGIADPLTGNITSVVTLKIGLVAPDLDTTAVLSLALTERPLDLNTGLPAQIGDTAFQLSVKIASLEAELYIKPRATADVVTSGGFSNLFELDLTNTGTSSITDMLLENITVFLADSKGQPISVRSVIEVGNTGFYEGEQKLTTAVAGQDELVLYFSDFIISASEQRTIVFKTRLKEPVAEAFSVRLDKCVINASFIDEYLADDSICITSDSEDSTLLSETYVTAGRTLETSFKIENNPFNPYDSPADFRYFLPEVSKVEFRIFSLIGEEVYARDIPEGSGAVGQLNEITWDGRNSNGDMVYNGVYIAILKILATGEEARMKVAVMK